MRFIFSITNNNVIGIKNDLACHIPHDLKWFKMNTHNSTVVMGHNTWKSLKYKPLPNRRNIVVTSKCIDNIETTTQSIPENSWIIGGATLFASTVESGDFMYITHIDIDIQNKDNKYIKIPKKRLLWKTRMYEYKNINYYFACYKVL